MSNDVSNIMAVVKVVLSANVSSSNSSQLGFTTWGHAGGLTSEDPRSLAALDRHRLDMNSPGVWPRMPEALHFAVPLGLNQVAINHDVFVIDTFRVFTDNILLPVTA